MTVVFVVCAAVGATVLVLQFLLSLVGLGGDALGVDVPHDLGHDVGAGDRDFGAGDTDHEVAASGMHGDASHATSAAAQHEANADRHDASASQVVQGSTWLFRVLSLRTIVAALAFFGLSGLAAEAADCTPFNTLLIASTAGLGAMYAVYVILQSMRSLQAEGTARIHRAVGEQATVYLRIPARRQGAGKIQINLQNRTMEYLATTTGDAIPSGTAVVVIKVLGADTVEVQSIANNTLLPTGENR